MENTIEHMGKIYDEVRESCARKGEESRSIDPKQTMRKTLKNLDGIK